MKIRQIVDELNLEVVVADNLDLEITGGYTGDLLSNVMAQACAGDLWFTIQAHQNVVAVGLLVEVAGIVIAEDVAIDEETIERAEEEGINLLRSSQSSYELSGRLYQLGVE